MTVITTEKPKAIDLRKTKSIKSEDQTLKSKEDVSKVSFAQKVSSTQKMSSTQKASVNSASNNDVQLAPTELMAGPTSVEAKTSDARTSDARTSDAKTSSAKTSEAKASANRTMVQNADQWRSCSRPHRI